MFTGIIQAVGAVCGLEPRGGDVRIRIDAGALDLSDLRAGDSVAVNGVCLTALEPAACMFSADVSLETLSCTTLSQLRVGSRVNLERALLPTTRMGGHLVSGHVDGVGMVSELRDAARSRLLRLTMPVKLLRYVAAKGSICVDGVSLTVNEISAHGFTVNIIPHTLECTIIGDYRCGTRVNIEVDLIARYIESLLAAPQAMPPGAGISRAYLAEHGFIKDD